MNKKVFSLLITVLMVLATTTSTVLAGGNVGLKSALFTIGSLDLDGTLTGLGGYTDGVQADLTATGTPVVTCVSPGGKDSLQGKTRLKLPRLPRSILRRFSRMALLR